MAAVYWAILHEIDIERRGTRAWQNIAAPRRIAPCGAGEAEAFAALLDGVALLVIELDLVPVITPRILACGLVAEPACVVADRALCKGERLRDLGNSQALLEKLSDTPTSH
jgi:hypothetical protein